MRQFAFSIVALSGLVVAAAVDAGSPRLSRISPPGGQRGTTVEVQFTGRYLEKPQEVMFYGPGITAESVELVEGETETNGRRDRNEPGTRVRMKLKVADDCPLGAHGMRLRTANGVSDFQRFFVGPFPMLEEEEQQQKRNDKRDSAKVVVANSTVFGRMLEAADIDMYRVDVKRGQRVSAEILAVRLGTERGIPDLHLTIFDPDGKELVAADDSALFVQDPVVSTVADRDGSYFVAVRHSIYSANNDIYLLHLGTFSRPTAIFPPGGQPGQELSVKVLGDPRGPWTQSVKLPAEQGGDFAFVPLDDGVPSPTPNKLRVSPLANVLEAEPNDKPDAVTSVTAGELPVAFSGIIDKPNDVDCFRFHAKKGDRFKVHAMANAFGSPLDPTITITSLGSKPGAPLRSTDSRPNQLGLPPSGGLNRDTLDPIIDFTVPADGDYVLGVEDDRGRGGSDFVYRVEFQPETDAVYTYVPLEPENQFTPQARQVINIPAGNRYNTSVSLINTNRPFSGELELVAIGLPEGVTMTAPHFSTGMPRVPVVFEAAADAKLQGCFVELVARPVIKDTAEKSAEKASVISGFRQVVAMNSYGNNDYYLHTPIDKLVLAVTEPSPFSIQVEEPKSALVQNGEMAIKFSVKRADGFDGPVTVSMEWRPNGVTVSTPVTIPSGQSEGQYLLGAARNASAGSYQVALTCVSGGERPGYYDNANRTYVASKPFKLNVAEPHIEARFARTSVERGKTANVVVKLNHLKPFEGKAKATLARLPRGVELVDAVREVSSEDKEVSFTVQATRDCLVGNYQGITLELTVVEDGQSVRQLSGSGLLRIDVERGVAAAR